MCVNSSLQEETSNAWELQRPKTRKQKQNARKNEKGQQVKNSTTKWNLATPKLKSCALNKLWLLLLARFNNRAGIPYRAAHKSPVDAAEEGVLFYLIWSLIGSHPIRGIPV